MILKKKIKDFFSDYLYLFREIVKNEKMYFLGRFLMKKNLILGKVGIFFFFKILKYILKLLILLFGYFYVVWNVEYLLFFFFVWLFNNGGVLKEMRGFININV